MTMRVRGGFRRRLIAVTASLAVIAATVVAAPQSEPAHAASALDFTAGKIVSDELFYDGSAMSATEVQSFLNKAVPRCTIGDAGRAAGMVWGSTTISDRCLRDFRVTTSTKPANAYCAAYAGATSESAAQIIARVAQACGISAKVLLVMLEKEQSLVNDTWPTVRQLDVAMGYACPDSGPNNSANCDSAYYGFFNQVYRAAWQLKVYKAHPANYNYKPFQTNTIQWHPNAACGTSQVYIENWATAALYIYTPYRPNQAALNAGWGQGDTCSSYGNRNFFLLYSSWFGLGDPAYKVAIDAKHSQNQWLGAAQSDYNSFSANGGGTVRAYENGAITWTSAGGAKIISGEFRSFYNSRGGVSGSLGWPTTDATAREGTRAIQGFTFAAVTSTPEHGFVVLSGTIREHYNSKALSLSGPLGWPTADQVCTSANQCSQTFEYGSIVQSGSTSETKVPEIDALLTTLKGSAGSPTTSLIAVAAHEGGFVVGLTSGAITWNRNAGAHLVTGPIRARFNALGGLSGALGWPQSERECVVGGICSQSFVGGQLWESPNGGVSMLADGIAARYTELLRSTNTIGYPIGDSITRTSNGGGVVQAFSEAAMTWSERSGAVILKEPIRGPYNSAGGLGSTALGWPMYDAVSTAGGTTQEFERGAVVSTPNGSTSILGDQIASAYLEVYGGPNGTLGWPSGSTNQAHSTRGTGTVQGFAGGALVNFPTVGTFALQGEIRAKYNTEGGLSGWLGWPTSNANVFSAHGGGSVQGFENGAILSSASGSFVLSGGLRTYYNSLGGINGPLGWPTTGPSCSANSCSQSFQNGSIRWSESTGGSRI